MSIIIAIVLAIMFTLSLAYIILQLYLYNLEMDVQTPPYDTKKYADATNKLCKLDVYTPFAFPFVFLFSGEFIGAILTIPILAVNIMRICRKEVHRESSVIYEVVQADSNFTLFKVVMMFIVWVYALVKFILALVL